MKLTTGVGVSAREVKEDMVMARGVGVGRWDFAGDVDVQTTTEWGRRRMSVRRSREMWGRWWTSPWTGGVAEVEACGRALGSRGGVMVQERCRPGVV